MENSFFDRICMPVFQQSSFGTRQCELTLTVIDFLIPILIFCMPVGLFWRASLKNKGAGGEKDPKAPQSISDESINPAGGEKDPKAPQSISDINPQLPKYEFFSQFLTEDIRQQFMKRMVLGEDPSMKKGEDQSLREKAIRFVIIIKGKVHCLSQNYFVQNEAYNDVSGGYRRYYTLIDEDIVEELLEESILKFADYFSIPEKTAFLIQVHRNTLKPTGVLKSIVGQGIHTDGAEVAGLLCLHRGDGCQEGDNQFHGKLDGSEPLCKPTRLHPGDAVFFQDNKIFHYVTRADGTKDADNSRVILLIHAPGELYLDGSTHKYNKNFLEVPTQTPNEENMTHGQSNMEE